MKVEIHISDEIEETHAVIYSNKMTDEIQQIADLFSSSSSNKIITAADNERIVVLKPKEIYMLRMENEKLFVYCQKERYISGKRLYEMEDLLGNEFMRISKFTLINRKEISSVEPSFNGTMLVLLKNGCKDYISRKYLPEFKKYLGL
ncbi:LytTR family DNA-binding domain-containing protein [Anaeromicropila herbilytica]|uniref:Transcriptional regulator n=1 Tax=Anaeromicropila herbilytica TaxID=2785025 RepID=A0A7R7EPF8_9FIRM|nr:LytTR family DNA-binding domain-containing protein [Anaeromicropila herbilytica]BCN32589.1 transcriptional regulator [Anaeromicropila herbilytica]